MNSPQAFIFIGRSGAGKGTQINLLLEYFKKNQPDQQILYVETGALFRQFLASSSYSSQLAKERNQVGVRGADFMAIYLWSNFLVEKAKPEQSLIFDGSPRSFNEAGALETALNFYKLSKINVIYLEVSVTCCTDRLEGRGRSDDIATGGIAKRLKWFEADVKPAIDYYRGNSFYHFVNIDGEQDPAKVHQSIVSQI